MGLHFEELIHADLSPLQLQGESFGRGTVLSRDAVSGTSCLATIGLSLRDKRHSSIEAPRIILALMG
jgi:hypothetical protein